jgi:hypothetical protein
MYNLKQNDTNRAYPSQVNSIRIMQLAKRKQGESIGFDDGGDTALILDANGKTLARYEYDAPYFSTEAYLNG